MKSHEKKHENENQKQETAVPEKIELSRAEHDQLLQKINELEGFKDKFLRAAADFDNAKKRFAKERDEFFKYALEGLIYDLLPVLDNFERALAHGEGNQQAKSLCDGFQLINKQLSSKLAECGLKRMDVIGKQFDPHLHEAVEHVVSDKGKDGEIVEEVLAGYELNGKLLRHPKVKVIGKPSTPPTEAFKEEELT